MLQVIDYLRSGHALAELESVYHVTPRRHGRYPNLVLLKYNQIESPMGERIVQECRGLILDEADDWRPVAVPYFKFFNYGEPNAVEIDWRTANVYEKLDGSLMTLYHYRDEWHVASSGTPDAEGDTGHGFTFRELFWRTWQSVGYALPDKRDSEHCFMFELMTPYNRIIVPHKTSRVVLHGVRHLPTLQERGLENWPWEKVRTFGLGSLQEIIASCSAINPFECEGYVVADAQFNRIKVKSPQYVAFAHMKDSMSARRMLEIIRANESEEFLTHFPEFRPLYDDLSMRFNALIAELDAEYAAIREIPDQKAFAARALKSRCSAALFSIRGGKARSWRDYFAGATLPSIERALGIDCATHAMDSLAQGSATKTTME